MQKDKIQILLIALPIVFLLLILRLAYLQLWSAQQYKHLATKNYLKPDVISAPRGVIYSRDGYTIADNIPTYTVIISSISKLPPSASSFLIRLLPQISLSTKQDTIKDVPFNMICKLEELHEQFPNVKIKAQPARRYIYANAFAHLIGYTGGISKQELTSLKGYRTGANIGKSGIEKQYEDFLKGKDGARYTEVDAYGHELGLLSYVPPEPGSDIWLNVDLDLQLLADSIFQAYNYIGCCVAMKPFSGEILVWMSRPAFDPNLFSTNLTPQMWNQVASDSTKPLFDRVINPQPPASIFKLVTCASAFDMGKLTPTTTQMLPCDGGITIGNRNFKCWGIHGSTNLIEAITLSCDVYFYQVGMDIGIEPICTKAKELGFGKATGVDLPRENTGFVPSKQWYESRYGRNWGKGIAANLSVGQGEILVTPLQILCFISGIATQGKVYTPTILSRAINSDGEEVFTGSSQYKTLPISGEALSAIREGMLGVVEASNGTGRAAIVPGIRVAGKSGTAQNPHGNTHAWFAAFAPFENPEICVVVFVEQGGMGGAVAAPIVQKIIQKYMSKIQS